jgi:flavin-dependent dehydrogenase
MRDVHEETIPLWRDGVQRPERAPLTADTRAAVAVVGAGIAGLSTAYALAREGVPVVVIDSGQVGSANEYCPTSEALFHETFRARRPRNPNQPTTCITPDAANSTE